ncbi:MAG: DUF4332 domain-containing protein [Myxococcota bacterium]
MSKLSEIEGIGTYCAAKLQAIGVTSIETLLERGRTPSGRREMSNACEMDGARILRWINMADLMRIKGVGEEYSDLLEAVGVDTVKELRQRVPENLLQKMKAVNEEKKLVRQLPTLAGVTSWIEQAKELDDRIEY